MIAGNKTKPLPSWNFSLAGDTTTKKIIRIANKSPKENRVAFEECH